MGSTHGPTQPLDVERTGTVGRASTSHLLPWRPQGPPCDGATYLVVLGTAFDNYRRFWLSFLSWLFVFRHSDGDGNAALER